MKPLFIAVALLMFVGCTGGFVYQKAEPLEFKDFVYPFPSSIAEIDGMQISYQDAGAGSRTLVLVHGLASNGGFWRYNIAELSRSFRVIAIDLPGYGKSSKEAYPYTMSFFAETVSKLLKKLQIDNAVYVGHSMGSQIGIHLAIRHPEQIGRLILASPAGFEPFSRGDGDWLKSVMTIDFVKKTTEDRQRANIASNFYSYDDRFEWMVEERARMAKAKDFEDFCYAVIRSVHGMIDEPTTNRLAEVKQPTLVIFGEKDGLIPNPILHGGESKDIAAIGTKAIPNVALIMIPEAGHMVQMEKPAEFNQAVLSWLK